MKHAALHRVRAAFYMYVSIPAIEVYLKGTSKDPGGNCSIIVMNKAEMASI